MSAEVYPDAHAPAMSKSERDARVAEVSRQRDEEWARAFVEGAAAYRAALLREHEASGDWMTAATRADAELRRRFGEAFDLAVKERE